MSFSLDTRPSPLAGRWYPADSQRLTQQIDGYLHPAAMPDWEGEVVALMVPHAGIQYSGPVAGYAFATLLGMPLDLAAVVAPMHYPHPGRLLTSAHRAYETPLGQVPVDADAVKRLDALLTAALGFGLTPVAYDEEHALEIELPFLQRAVARPFGLLPVMVRDQSETTARALGLALACLASDLAQDGRRMLLVASTDLSHFFPQDVAHTLDGEMLRRVKAFDPVAVLHAEEEGKAFACGRAGLAAVLWASRELGADRIQILRHATSGDITGDPSSVVGYAAAVALKSK